MMLSAFLLGLFGLAACQTGSTFSPARPPALPLAVRNPYLNTYQPAGSDGGNGGYLAGEWPVFWNGAITGWTGIIKVDLVNYIWMGAPNVSAPLVQQVAYNYTSTRSTFTMNVNGAVRMVIEFLSPVTPNDMMRASFPVSYMDVQVSSLDGLPHFVQLYTDVTGEWVSGDRSSTVQWNYGSTGSSGTKVRRGADEDEPVPAPTPEDIDAPELLKRQQRTFTTYATQTAYTGWTTAVAQTSRPVANSFTAHAYPAAPSKPTAVPSHSALPTNPRPGGVAYHQFFRQQQLQFSEFSDQTQYGNWYYATNNVFGLTHQSGSDVQVRGQFTRFGFLSNTQDTNYRAINNSYPTFAFSNNLGIVFPGQTVSTLYTMNLAQSNVIEFEGASGNQTLPGLWKQYFASDLAAVSFFYNDFATASNITSALDRQIASDSLAAAGQNYLTLTSLSVRQAFGALQLADYNGSPLLFLKEISSDGNVNTADVIFPFHPITVYLNPTLLKLVLEPLFINQAAGYWPKAYAIHDIGSAYPNATGHNDGNAEQQPLEECGDMILMTLAYAQRSGDTAFLSQYYPLLRQWNNYLVQDALIPANQISTDDFAGALANQTNLALKGIIGIQAMSQIASLTGNAADAQNFSSIAHSYIKQWQVLAAAAGANPPHTTLNYGNATSYSLLYNLYADRELGLGLVPQSVYDTQSAFYPTVAKTYGVPLDTRHTYTKSDWQTFCASIASASTKALFFQKLATYINQTPQNLPVSDLYDTLTANYPGIYFIARPVVGGHFAQLALNSAPTPK